MYYVVYQKLSSVNLMRNLIRLQLLGSRIVVVGSLLYPAFRVGLASYMLDVLLVSVQCNAAILCHP